MMKLSKTKNYIYQGEVVKLTGRSAQSLADDGDYIIEIRDSEDDTHWVSLDEVYELGGSNE